MNDLHRPTVAAGRHPGRLLVLFGLLLALAGPGLYAVQWQAKVLAAPWYVPILATVGLALAVVALVQARSLWRWAAAIFLCLFAGAEWLMLLVVLGTPAYAGPVEAGQPFPPFSTTLADGSPFTQEDLKGDRSTVMVFFRGRW
jgi:hypothetical protein